MYRSRSLSLVLFFLIAIAFLAAVPAAAVRSTEESLTESLTRGSRFTATITGIPNTTYYIWIPRTFSMTGEPYDQPPVIADYTLNFAKDPEGGPYTIGLYQYYNGNGRTIRDDIAPTTTPMSNTNYYGKVSTDDSGQAVVEFQTSVYTGLRSYSVRVENPAAAENDHLDVAISVYSRGQPANTIIPRETTPGPVNPTPALTSFPFSPEPILTVTQPQVPYMTVPEKTTVPATRKASAGPVSCTVALVTLVILVGMRCE